MIRRRREAQSWLASACLGFLCAGGLVLAIHTSSWFRAPQQAYAAAQAHKPAPSPSPATQVISAPYIARPGADASFPVGETLVYSAQWRVFNAGIATLRLESAGREDRVLGTADASGAVAVLYHVQDRFESFFDPATFCSHNISRHIEEGFRRVESTITFDYQNGKAVLNQKNIKKNETRHEEHGIQSCVTDVLSGIYYVASLALEPGRSFMFPLNDGGNTVTVNLRVEAREQVKTPAGTFNTIRVQPEASSGVLKDKGKIWIWYSDDKPRIPVQMRARMYWGTLTFTLLRVEKK